MVALRPTKLTSMWDPRWLELMTTDLSIVTWARSLVEVFCGRSKGIVVISFGYLGMDEYRGAGEQVACGACFCSLRRCKVTIVVVMQVDKKGMQKSKADGRSICYYGIKRQSRVTSFCSIWSGTSAHSLIMQQSQTLFSRPKTLPHAHLDDRFPRLWCPFNPPTEADPQECGDAGPPHPPCVPFVAISDAVDEPLDYRLYGPPDQS